jgi:methionyl-tRNA formyltransferase
MRCGFAGTPAFAAHILERLIESSHQVPVVYTQPDRPAGRGRKSTPSAVRSLAENQRIPVRTPSRLKSADVVAALEALHLDVLVVAAYGLILPQAVLDAPRIGCINVHASLLPRWRGAAPIERAMMAGDLETGVTIMKMERGLDTGDVYATAHCPIADDATGDSLHAQLAELGARCLLEVLAALPDLTPVPQNDSEACYADKLTSADQRLDFANDASHLARQVRALNSRAPTIAYLNGERVRLLLAEADQADPPGNAPPGVIIDTSKHGIRVACGHGQLLVTQLQLSRGKGKPMPAAAAINGFPDLFTPGSSFDANPE